MNFSRKNREHFIQKIRSESFDVVIIGGGVTGAGALLDAQSRGLKACLIEMQDFSQGTSSRSTKLIHGGLRYLKQLDLKLVAEVGRERNTLKSNASYLTQPTEVIIPFEEGGSMNKWTARLAMIAYEFLAKVEPKYRHTMLRKRTVRNLLPNLNDTKLKGGVIYYEYKTNDSRLTIELIKKAVSMGAVALNYCKAVGFQYTQNEVSAIELIDLLSQEKMVVRTKACITAAGPWTDDVLKLENQSLPNKLVLTKGIHIVFQKSRFPLHNAVYFEVGDGRMLFGIPKFDKVYVGTTDTFYTDQKEEPNITIQDVQYLLDAVNQKFNVPKLTKKEVVAAWSGLRPLVKQEGKGESEISRKDEVFVSDSGIVAIAGGKLTGYRKMAEKVVDLVAKRHAEKTGESFKKCVTEDLKFLGHDTKDEKTFLTAVKLTKIVSQLEAEKLYHWFGKQAYDVLNEHAVEGLPTYLGKALVYCTKNEMVTNPIDFLIHRTQLAYYDVMEAKGHLLAVHNYLMATTGKTSLSMEKCLAVLNDLKAFKKEVEVQEVE